MEPPTGAGLRRFAVLWHSGIERPHFDFLVETGPGSDLATWRLQCWPVVEPGEAIRLRDHRRMYLEYQGQVGGDRGEVEKVDGGECQLDIGRDADWRVLRIDGTGVLLRPIAGDRWNVFPSAST